MQPVTTDSTKLYEFLAWVEVHKKQLISAVCVGLFLFLVVYIYSYYREQTEWAANRALLMLRTTQDDRPAAAASSTDLLKVASQYGSTSAGERALLLAAGNLFADGNYAEAQKQFERFRKEHSGSPLASVAAFGIAASMDALDQVDAALGAYQSVVNQFPDEAVAPRARLAMAILHETKSQPDQAYRIYDELSKQVGVGAIAGEATSRREKLRRQFPQLAPTNAPVATASTTGIRPSDTTSSNSSSTNRAVTPAAPTEAAQPK